MLNFDKHGNVKPYSIITISLEEFATIFTQLENQEHRQYLFEKYLDYLHELIGILKVPFFQLIDGSFITQKRLPNDIDIVSFAPYERSLEVKKQLEKLFYESKNKYFVDGYFAWLPNKDEQSWKDASETYDYWVNLYSNTRFDEITHKTYPKGIIKINFD